MRPEPRIPIEHKRAAVLLAAWLVALVPSAAPASSVLEFDVREVVQGSALIFEGTVEHVESRALDGGTRNIWTFVRFRVHDVVKGRYAPPTIELGFLGGTANGVTLRVSDLELPEIGERGVYFVESLARRQIHPLFGWHQGHYRLLRDTDGVERVHTRRGRAVTAVRADAPRRAPRGLSRGAPAGVETAAGAGAAPAVSAFRFKRLVRDLLARGRR